MANCFWFYSMMGEWSTWQWVVLDFSQFSWSFDTPDTPGSVSVVFAENEIWNRLKQFLPVWNPDVKFNKTGSKKPPLYEGCRIITVRPLFVLFRTCDILQLFWFFSRHTWRRLHLFRKSSTFLSAIMQL